MMHYTKAELRSKGAYAITCQPIMRTYVGITVRFVNRWTKHKLLLRTGTHHNRALQSDWDRYGESAFEFIILETGWPTRALERKHLALYPGAYNIEE